MKVKVQCTLIVEIEVDDTVEEVEYFIEEHHCPGTGPVGDAIDLAIETHNLTDTCWACALQGQCKILEISR